LYGRRTVTGLQHLLKGSPLGLGSTQVPVNFYLHPIDSVITPVSSVGGLPFLRSSGTLLPVSGGCDGYQVVRIRHIVGEGRFSALVPCPATRIVSVLEWDHVVYVQPGGISDGLPGVRREPLPGCHLALPVGLEGDLCQRFLDQDFVPGVLAIFVSINPMPPVIPVVGR